MKRTRIAASLFIAIAFAVPHAGAADPIRIGVPTSLTGPYVALGEEVKRGVTFAVNEVNAKGGIAGRKVEAVFADTEGNPDIGRRAAEKLVLGGSKLLVGAISSAVGLAVGAQVERWDALYLSSINKSNRLTTDACNPRMFRANHSDAMDMAVVGPWLKGRKEKGWVIIAADYAWGRDSADEFAAAAAAAGKTIKGKFFAPLGTKDYAPYIQQIKDLKPEGMWVAIAGRDAVNFGVQAGQFGLLKSVFTVGQSFAVPSTISGMGEAANGVWGIVNYTATIDTPGNKAFVADWMKANSKEPANFEAETYVAMKLLFAAIAKAGSSEPAAVAKALETTTVDIPFYGQVSMRAEDHQLRLPNFMGRVAKVNGELKLVVEQRVEIAQAMPAPSKACKMSR